MEVKIKKLREEAILPTYATPGAACFDLHAAVVRGPTVVRPGSARVINTGLAFEIPEDHVMLVFSRSGHGFKQGVRLSNCVGVIDSDYRGEVMVKLHSDGCGIDVDHGDRIAQALILPVQQVSFVEVDELGTTARGNGGFGSTGS